MKNSRPLKIVVAALVCFGTVAAAHAQAALPQPKTFGDVTYLNGGAGDEEVQFVRQAMKEYSLALSFARAGSPRAEYVASVAITIKDAKGATVFESPSAGPYLLLKLPAGRYTVVATYQDVSQTRQVVAGRSASAPTTFTWT